VLITPAGLDVLRRMDEVETDLYSGLTNLTEAEATELSRLLDKVRNKGREE
jgi:hypothetical protein